MFRDTQTQPTAHTIKAVPGPSEGHPSNTCAMHLTSFIILRRDKVQWSESCRSVMESYLVGEYLLPRARRRCPGAGEWSVCENVGDLDVEFVHTGDGQLVYKGLEDLITGVSDASDESKCACDPKETQSTKMFVGQRIPWAFASRNG